MGFGREYVVLSKYAEHMGINSGDIIFISLGARKMMWDAVSHGEKVDLNELYSRAYLCKMICFDFSNSGNLLANHLAHGYV